MQNKRDHGIDLLRIFACFSLIPFHYCTYGQMDASLSFQYTSEVVKSLFGFHVPWFLMISGALFLGKEKIDIKRLYTHNIAHLLLVYVFWSAVYAVFDVLINIGNVTDIKNLIIWIVMDIRDSHYHLWYLPMIIGIYILVPLIHAAVGNDRNYNVLKYLFVIFVVFGVVIYTFLLVPIKADTYSLLLKRINIGTFSEWIGFFISGYFLYQIKDKISKKTTKILVILSAISMIVILAVNMAMVPSQGINSFLSYYSIPGFIIECSLFLVFVRINAVPEEKKAKIITATADCMLGVYCIHDLVLSLVHMAFDFIPDSLYIVRLLIVIPITFALCILIVTGMRKSKLLRKIAV